MLKLIREQFISRLDHIHRFNGTPLIPPGENVAQHSFWVTFYANLFFRDLFWLALRHTDTVSVYFEMYNFLIRKAMCHDFDEAWTGDVLWSTKYHPSVGLQLKELLDKIVAYQASNTLPLNSVLTDEITSVLWNDREPGDRHTVDNAITHLSPIQKDICITIVKIADWISCYHFCYGQYCLGNKLVSGIMDRAVIELKKVVVSLLKILETSQIPFSASALETIINY